MSTELTDPVDVTETIATQDIMIITLHMDLKMQEFNIISTDTSGKIIADKKYVNLFADMGSTQQQNIRDVLNNTRQYARSIGVLGEGEDTDDISG